MQTLIELWNKYLFGGTHYGDRPYIPPIRTRELHTLKRKLQEVKVFLEATNPAATEVFSMKIRVIEAIQSRKPEVPK